VTLVQDLKAIRFLQGTKISHDYDGDRIDTFSYRELIGLNSPCIGIPCKPNGLLIIDVDVEGPTHKKDGREFWTKFSAENGMPDTYTVGTPSGGFHYYFKLPESINPDTFVCPKELSQGIDIKWNGWVGAPPSQGYTIVWGDVSKIQIAPPSLMLYISSLIKGASTKTFDFVGGDKPLVLHRPFTPAQLHELKKKIEWLQTNGSLSRSEWRDGIFSMKAGIDDPVLLDEMLDKWSHNRAYSPGDEDLAREMAAKSDKHGPVGPGTVLAILRQVAQREGAPVVETPFTTQEIIDRSKIQIGFNKDGSIKVEASESNAAALLGAIFDDTILYHDSRTDLYIYKGKSHSDTELVNMFLPIIQSPTYGLGLEKFRKSAVAAGLDVLMSARQKDPHQIYLKSLTWDGIKRIEKFFPEYVGAEDSAYTRLVGANFWTSLAARGLRPGCKFDSMVVLEGHEGIAKSSLVEAIGGEYTFTPAKKDALKDLDTLRAMHQSVIVELPELLGLVGETSEVVKGFLAKPFDHIRALFAKRAMKSMRGFIFVGTTNSDKYLAATMGIRRFWPIKIPKAVRFINMSKVKCDRDQLFAEGIAMLNDGHKYWHVPEEMLDVIVEARVMDEPLMSPIKEMIPVLGNSWSSTDIYKRLEAGGLITRGLSSVMVGRIDSALSRLGCEYNVEDGNKLWKNKVSFQGYSLDSLM
jgi:hypothetical protein